ncbi:type II toxin-antitoxin system HicB family antitoxin [Candidatus Woesearchaeota archaeon]|nr:type II toxin-antitoxin system HicB family antitoxin [Candidatus Woesearchaeota archaeon]
MDFTAIIKKGEKQFVALCPELDVVSQGYTVEESLKNLKEAVELYIEEMGVPEGATSKETIVASFEVKQ